MLELRSVDVNYGHIQAVKKLSLRLEEGEVVALIGANGAGKTTALNAISGLVPVAGGSIIYRGRDITGRAPQTLVQEGIVQVPEGRAILTTLKVKENLELGAFVRRDGEKKRDMEALFQRFPILKEKADELAGNLSGGEQQLLALGRALMARPQLLLLDEPSMGLAPRLVREIFDIIQEINREGTALLLVEQNASMALQISRRGYVLERGRLMLEGSSSSLLNDRKVREAYLGG